MAIVISAIFMLLFSFIIKGAQVGGVGVSYGAAGTNLPAPAEVARFLSDRTVIDRVRLLDPDPSTLRAFAGSGPGLALALALPASLVPALTDLSLARRLVQALILPLAASPAPSPASSSAPTSPPPQPHPRPRPRPRHAEPPHRPRRLRPPPPRQGLRPAVPRHPRLLVPALLRPLRRRRRRHRAAAPLPAGHGRAVHGERVPLPRGHPGNPRLRPLQDQPRRRGPRDGAGVREHARRAARRRVRRRDEARVWGVEIAVGETGWPTSGVGVGVGVGVDFAREYNANLVRHVASGVGTPLMPNRTFETYVSSMFDDDDLGPGPTSAARNFGLFRPDFTPVYDIGLLKPDQQDMKPAMSALTPTSPTASDLRRWCIAKPNADVMVLQENLDYACGQGINCSPIQPGGACYYPDTVQAHAAYAMNEYYQASGRNTFDCDFGQSGMVMTTDPSYGNCKYSS
uniref:X8 domain-containing protein n=1 Tax=Ananas comosus var. bracteatus TaxID=296719 RepID=A0A6V7NR84_ANACO|nr:unnamed protein product [Ananas comosus var. bracteatus]